MDSLGLIAQKKDPRNWFQKFMDQTSFAPIYTFQITKVQAYRALQGLRSIPSPDWRTTSLIDTVEAAISTSTKVGEEEVVTFGLDNSDSGRLKIVLPEVSRKNISQIVEDDGFVKTTRHYTLE